MQLGKFTDYGLRLLIQQASVHPERQKVSTVAKTFGLSEHHLAKICATLVKSGHLTSERGRSGGIALAMSPSDIRLGSVVRALTGSYVFVECDNAHSCMCRLLPACGLRAPIQRAREAFFNELDQTTLEQALGDRNAVRATLAV